MSLTILPNPSMDFTPLNVLTADEMDDLVENIEAINNCTIQTASIANGAITKVKLAQDALDNYSLSEADTGATWIDGKKIYKKTVNFGAEPSANQEKTVNANISNLDKVIRLEGIGFDNSGSSMPLPYAKAGTSNNYELSFYQGKVAIEVGSVSVGMTQIYVTLWYTKTS